MNKSLRAQKTIDNFEHLKSYQYKTTPSSFVHFISNNGSLDYWETV